MVPDLSIVLISYNIPRELPRTLYSLSPAFQRDVSRDDYEVILVDNGSAVPPTEAEYGDLNLNLRCLRNPDPRPSPVDAINLGLAEARGRWIGVCIDGARILSPGLLHAALQALRLSPRAVVGSRGRYLGPDFQSSSVRRGYSRAKEDQLLEAVNWREQGYNLFDISVLDESSIATWFAPIAESNSLFMSRALWDEVGGYDASFVSAGGGMVNLDTWTRATSLPGTVPIVLLGEATFHQLHGGSSTNHPEPIARGLILAEEYRTIRGIAYKIPQIPLRFWGTFVHQPPRHELLGGLWSPQARRLVYEYWRYRLKTRISSLMHPGSEGPGSSGDASPTPPW